MEHCLNGAEFSVYQMLKILVVLQCVKMHHVTHSEHQHIVYVIMYNTYVCPICRIIFWGSKILNFNFLGGFRKINIFWGMEILWTFFGGHHKIGLYLEIISMHFRVFS